MNSGSFTVERSGWVDTAIVEIEPAPGLRAVYQVVPMTDSLNFLNPVSLWRDDLPAVPVEGPIRIAKSGTDLIVVVRSTDGVRLSGTVAEGVYWDRSPEGDSGQ